MGDTRPEQKQRQPTPSSVRRRPGERTSRATRSPTTISATSASGSSTSVSRSPTSRSTSVGTLIGYTARYVDEAGGTTDPALMEVRFPVEMDGTPLPLAWEVDDELSGQRNDVVDARFRDERSTVLLEVTNISDPNATPTIRDVDLPAGLHPPDDREIAGDG